MADEGRGEVNQKAATRDLLRHWAVPAGTLVLLLMSWAWQVGYTMARFERTQSELEDVGKKGDHIDSRLYSMELEHAVWRKTLQDLASMREDVEEIKERLAEDRGRRGIDR